MKPGRDDARNVDVNRITSNLRQSTLSVEVEVISRLTHHHTLTTEHTKAVGVEEECVDCPSNKGRMIIGSVITNKSIFVVNLLKGERTIVLSHQYMRHGGCIKTG